MASQADFLLQEYVSRINRVIDYVDAHLDSRFSLEQLAGIACFSRFHFHRIFAAMVGETIGDFVRRLRLERAASALVSHPRQTVTDVALDCGFSSPSVFARAFKERFGVSASTWRGRSKHGEAVSNRRQALRNGGEALKAYAQGHNLEYRRRKMSKLAYSVEVKELPELHVAYVRHIGAYQQIGQAFDKLMRWAGPRGLLRFPETKCLAVYHDSPEITETNKLRSDACITVPPGTPVDAEIGLLTIPGGKFAVGHFEVAADQFGEAWNALIGDWLPESGYQPDDRMCYELYLNDHEQHPQKKFIVDICEPIKPL